MYDTGPDGIGTAPIYSGSLSLGTAADMCIRYASDRKWNNRDCTISSPILCERIRKHCIGIVFILEGRKMSHCFQLELRLSDVALDLAKLGTNATIS